MSANLGEIKKQVGQHIQALMQNKEGERAKMTISEIPGRTIVSKGVQNYTFDVRKVGTGPHNSLTENEIKLLDEEIAANAARSGSGGNAPPPSFLPQSDGLTPGSSATGAGGKRPPPPPPPSKKPPPPPPPPPPSSVSEKDSPKEYKMERESKHSQEDIQRLIARIPEFIKSNEKFKEISPAEIQALAGQALDVPIQSGLSKSVMNLEQQKIFTDLINRKLEEITLTKQNLFGGVYMQKRHPKFEMLADQPKDLVIADHEHSILELEAQLRYQAKLKAQADAEQAAREQAERERAEAERLRAEAERLAALERQAQEEQRKAHEDLARKLDAAYKRGLRLNPRKRR